MSTLRLAFIISEQWAGQLAPRTPLCFILVCSTELMCMNVLCRFKSIKSMVFLFLAPILCALDSLFFGVARKNDLFS